MRVLHLSAHDITGGAARAAHRLHLGLERIGVRSTMLVQFKASDDSQVIAPSGDIARAFVRLRSRLDKVPLTLYPGRERVPYSVQWIPSRIGGQVAQLAPDVINLHWVCAGYLGIESIARLRMPLVWTLHDMWPFTGGCHSDQGCGRYAEACGTCPLLHSTHEHDLSHWTWWRKSRAWRDLDLAVVAPSGWLAACARQSSLFKDFCVDIIPHGLDTDRYKPVDTETAREILNLPQNKHLILIGGISASTDHVKGRDLLRAGLCLLSKSVDCDTVDVAVFGAQMPETSLDWQFRTHYLGFLHDTSSLSLAYSAADVVVFPSRQEAFGQIVSEAFACGTPVVAFNSTGPKDIIEHQHNGFLAEPFDVRQLARGIKWVLQDDERRQVLGYNARRKAVQLVAQSLQAQRYLTLYERILELR